jgi:hypothetical protein
MINMKIEDIREIKQTTIVSEVNQLLSNGYVLIKILSSRAGEQILPIYILGRSA